MICIIKRPTTNLSEITGWIIARSFKEARERASAAGHQALAEWISSTEGSREALPGKIDVAIETDTFTLLRDFQPVKG